MVDGRGLVNDILNVTVSPTLTDDWQERMRVGGVIWWCVMLMYICWVSRTLATIKNSSIFSSTRCFRNCRHCTGIRTVAAVVGRVAGGEI